MAGLGLRMFLNLDCMMRINACVNGSEEFNGLFHLRLWSPVQVLPALKTGVPPGDLSKMVKTVVRLKFSNNIEDGTLVNLSGDLIFQVW